MGEERVKQQEFCEHNELRPQLDDQPGDADTGITCWRLRVLELDKVIWSLCSKIKEAQRTVGFVIEKPDL